MQKFVGPRVGGLFDLSIRETNACGSLAEFFSPGLQN